MTESTSLLGHVLTSHTHQLIRTLNAHHVPVFPRLRAGVDTPSVAGLEALKTRPLKAVQPTQTATSGQYIHMGCSSIIQEEQTYSLNLMDIVRLSRRFLASTPLSSTLLRSLRIRSWKAFAPGDYESWVEQQEGCPPPAGPFVHAEILTG